MSEEKGFRITEGDSDLISKFIADTYKDDVSKFSDEVTAASLDASSTTVTQQFDKMVRLVKPIINLEDKGIVRVKEVKDNTDKATFSVARQQGFTFTTVDERGSEKTSLAAGSESYQSVNAPIYVQVSPLTKSTTMFIHENERLVDPYEMAELMAQVQEEIASAKEIDAYSVLGTAANYTASVSIRFAGGYSTASGYITSANVLTFDDLDAAKKDLKTQNNASSSTRKIVPDTVLIATEQFCDLKDSALLAPGQSTSGQYRMAKFDGDGELVSYNKMAFVESVNMPQIKTGYFASSNGHYCYVGKKNLMVGRGENSKRNKVRSFENPEDHGIRYTIDINFAQALLFPKGIRAICATDE